MSDAAYERLDEVLLRDASAPLLRGWLPVYRWSVRQRAIVAVIVAVTTCTLAGGLCVATDVAGAVSAKAALSDARHRLADARRALTQLPALRRTSAPPTERYGMRGSADDTRDVSRLAAATGVTLVSLEPGATGGQAEDSFRTLKLVAHGDFAQIRRFLRGLTKAPVLIAPAEVTLKRNGSGLSIAATLSFFDALRAPPAAGTDEAAPQPDPFALRFGSPGSGVEFLRLAGMIQDATHTVALIETPEGTAAVEAGQQIAGERVAHIAPPQVTLVAGGVTRTLKWAEDAQ